MAMEWDKARSKKQLMDVALSIRGIEYLANAISEGWGLDADYIADAFARFNDGRYIRDAEGYTSALYCKIPHPIDIRTSTALLIGLNEANVSVNRICELHIVNSVVTISGTGNAVVYLYNSKIANADTARCVIKRR